MSTRTAHTAVQAPSSALDALLATEQEIAQHFADAERRAREILDAAHTDAEETHRVAAIALAEELASIDARSLRDIAAAVSEIEREAEQLVRRYRAVPDAEIATLAELVVAELTGLGAAS
ncbi:MAG: hypothetical protein NTZ43_08625 [Gemmatimonadetes bacterium]|nr:hypothetical protein [Gemmatimonadota bacterium]